MSYALASPVGRIRAAQTRRTTPVLRRRGLGLTVHGVELEYCGATTDPSCAQRNDARVQASYGESTAPYVDQTNPAGWMPIIGPFLDYSQRLALAASVPQSAVGAAQIQAQLNPVVVNTASATTPASYSPRVSFQNSRGGSTLYPGDTWTITITGAQPGSQIKVTGGKNGVNDTNVMGSADSSGKFSLSGTIASDSIGSWSETWTAGGVSAGSFSFTVVAGPGGSTCNPPQSLVNGQCVLIDDPAKKGPVPPGTVTTSGSWFTESMIGGIPNWMLLAGAAAGYFALKGGR